VVLAIQATSAQEIFKDVSISSVERVINAQTQLVKIDTTLTLKNERDAALKDFYVTIPNEYAPWLKHLIVVDQKGTELPLTPVDNLKIQSQINAHLYKVTLDRPLNPGGTKTVVVNEIYFGGMEPLPKRITLHEDQKVVLTENTVYFTPYIVLSQTITFKLASSPLTYSDDDGKLRGATLEYKTLQTVDPFTHKPTRIHFENNTPFTVFKKVVKTIEVSHWGNIHIEESYQLANEGAEFKGEYSRIDFNPSSGHTGKNSLKQLYAHYPHDAWGMDYRDEVGNISTSRAVRESDHVGIQITPRYPIFGGWRANWEISYNLPAKNYLSYAENDLSQFVLKQTFGFPIGGVLAEDYTLKVIIPEGAHDLKIDLPFSIDDSHDSKTFSYLDYEGRPTRVVHKKNVLEYHHREFEVSYKFENKNIFIEPILLFIGIFIIFIILIFIGRIDFDFGKKKSD